jgi:hypothetical protein
MTKIGEGKTPEEPTIATYRANLEQSAVKFENALESYQMSTDYEEKLRLKEIMNQQLALIKSSVEEIKQGGIYKEQVKVETDYQKFMENPSAENTAALEHDLQTLRDYNNTNYQK